MTSEEFLIDLYAQRHFYTNPHQNLKIIYKNDHTIKNIILPARAGTWKKLEPIDKKLYLDMARHELKELGVELNS